jgi:hypothetical protein
MESAAGERGKTVENRPAGSRRWEEFAKKMFFRGNELKVLL